MKQYDTSISIQGKDPMKKLTKHCLHCGSEAIGTMIDEVKPVFRMEVITYACGAVMKNITGARGRIGRLSHEGCGLEPVESP
jgi:hypothetical protein